LWEIPPRFHCPVIGTCLGVPELRRIGARHARATETASDYEVHVGFVAAAGDRNALSLAAHKAMDRKFHGTIKRFERARDPEALRALWSECLTHGEVAGALWALMSHPRADDEVLHLAYEEVHMLSHQVGATQRADLRRLAETRGELETLRRDFDALVSRSRRQAEARDCLIQDLERKLIEREGALTARTEREEALTRRLAALEADARAERARVLEARITKLEEALEAARRAEREAGAACAELRSRLAAESLARQEKEAECTALERLLAAGLGEPGDESGPCEDCPNRDCPRRDLAGRTVLCVGGRLPQVRQFGQLVRECNGRFDHHDGGLEDGDRRLEALLAGADIVVCATDFVSHGAYHRTKRFCKRFDKPHVLLAHSGLAAFALALDRVAT